MKIWGLHFSMTIKTGDILGLGLLGISIWILSGIKLIGIIGAVITILVELVFLYEKWLK